MFESGNTLEKRKCPIDGSRVKYCIRCKTCAIMNGFGGAVTHSLSHASASGVYVARRILENR